MPKDHAAACTCASCEARAYTRNNYFTGKLMVERDFTDEQRYGRDKWLRHHERLHGTGVVCGLQVRAHEDPCDDRYVILEPGSAIDCCGQDIIVIDEDIIDLQGFAAMQDLLREAEDPDTPADRTWDLQLCIAYTECPTEDVPILYDECGCDDSRCAPNRILESYRIDLLVDPEIAPPALLMPGLSWAQTVGIDNAIAAIVDAPRGRAFVLTGGPAGAVYQVDMATLAITASFSLARDALALAVSQSGSMLYVAAADAGGLAAGDSALLVFDLDAANVGAGPDREFAISGSQASHLSLIVLPDDRLLAFVKEGGRLRLWDVGVTAPANDLGGFDPAASFTDPTVLSDGMRVIAAVAGTGVLHHVDLATAGPDMTTFALADGVADEVATIGGSPVDVLAVADATAGGLRIVDLAGATIGSVALDHAPLDMAITPSGRFAYVLVQDGDDRFVQTVPLSPLRAGEASHASQPIPVGRGAVQIKRAAERLWVPYLGPDDAAGTGGVAVLDITETDCKALLYPDDCPTCSGNDCITLATIRNYRPGDRLLDMPAPAIAPVAGTAHIDNILGRKRLPSTQAIAEALLCVMDNCCGTDVAEPEPDVPPAPGPDPDPVPPPFELPTATRICAISWPHLGVADDSSFPRVSMPAPDNDSVEVEDVALPGFVIAFDRQTHFHGSIPPAVLASDNPQDIHRYASSLIRLKVGLLGDGAAAIDDPDYMLWAEVPMLTMPVELALSERDADAGTCQIDDVVRLIPIDEDTAATGRIENGLYAIPLTNISAEGLRNLFFRQWLNDGTVEVQQSDALSYRFDLTFDGNALIDFEQKPIDAEHIAPFLPARASGNRWPGGVFESSFFFQAPPEFPDIQFFPILTDGSVTPGGGLVGPGADDLRINVNTAGIDELLRLPNVGQQLANNIIAARPIRDDGDLLSIAGMGPNVLSRIRDTIVFD